MIYETAVFSVIIQALTTVIELYGLTLPVPENLDILKDILKVEVGVQTVEMIFYIWLIYAFQAVKNITLYRYADWFITTPIMLITLMAYLNIGVVKGGDTSFAAFLQDHKVNIAIVVALNALMLLFGVLSEMYPARQWLYVFLGFLPFFAYFYHIYKEYYVKPGQDIHPVFTRSRVFWYFVVIWGLYGLFALLPYVPKNTYLNILDLFSKNAFGIMLVLIISHNSAEDQQHSN